MNDGKKILIGEHLYPDFCKKITKIFKCYMLSVEYSFDHRVAIGDCWIGGLYDHEIVRNNVILCLVVSPHTNSIILDETSWHDFAFTLTQTLQHELIHRHQYDVRTDDCVLTRYDFPEENRTLFEEREYLSHIDEIDAYAHCIALELKRKYKEETIRKQLRSSKLRGCPSWNSYKKAFRGDNWYQIRRELLRHIYKWLSTAIPYKENV